MKVIEASDVQDGFVATVTFDNGLVLGSEFTPDCCAYNFLDFEQMHVGREFPPMTGEEFLAAITKKEDGFSVKDSFGVPAWVQARSAQNGYYSTGVDLTVEYGGALLNAVRAPYSYDHMFSGLLLD